MDIHEYQAKQLLSKFGVVIPQGFPILNLDEVEEQARKLPGPIYVLKSQIHAGGRGKGTFKEAPDSGGGVRVLKSIEEVKENAGQMLGNTLVTIQTGPEGKQVNRLYVEEGSNIEKELYISLLVDRDTSKVSIIASSEGGMDIEEVAEKTPEKISTIAIDPEGGISDSNIQELANVFGLEGDKIDQLSSLVDSLYKAFLETDAAQVEINPLVITKEGNLLVLDAKYGFDDNALFRHPDIEELRDETEENPAERKANEFELSYVKMDGSIGCMVNGAGLAMATMDIIKLKGGEPANFLDVGGGATKERVIEAFKIILSDPNVNAILVNIFGGIMRCDVIAEGIIEAAKDVSLSVPLVVRLEGTNVELGKKIIAESDLDVIPADDLEDAASKVVEAVNKRAS